MKENIAEFDAELRKMEEFPIHSDHPIYLRARAFGTILCQTPCTIYCYYTRESHSQRDVVQRRSLVSEQEQAHLANCKLKALLHLSADSHAYFISRTRRGRVSELSECDDLRSRCSRRLLRAITKYARHVDEIQPLRNKRGESTGRRRS